jgi:hypothetical protein
MEPEQEGSCEKEKNDEWGWIPITMTSGSVLHIFHGPSADSTFVEKLSEKLAEKLGKNDFV